MSLLAKVRSYFDITWTTILVGWNGLGAFSPWIDRRDDFPPLLSADEITAYANERLESSSDVAEVALLAKLLSLDLRTETRQSIRDYLTRLSVLRGSDPTLELRKWRVVLLEELLESMPKDAVYGLTALTEFWQGFGYPPDSPHEVQGRGRAITPFDYYQEQNLIRLVNDHRVWANQETATLRGECGVEGDKRNTNDKTDEK